MFAENLLAKLNPEDTTPFQWENESEFTRLPDGGIRITAPAECDFFRDPTGRHTKDSAPYLYTHVTGDFVAKAHVRHPFRFTWDATALMVRIDPENWAKICFEGTDFDTHAIVSVVTKGVSDDANGVNYHWPDVWLQIVRVGNVFGLHYGPDGEHWNMVRLFSLDAPGTIKLGMVAQCPGGSGSEMDFYHFSIENKTVEDVRAGV